MKIEIEKSIHDKANDEFARVCAAAAGRVGTDGCLEWVAAFCNQSCSLIGAYLGSNHIAIHAVDSSNRLTGPRLAIITLPVS